MDLRKQRHWHRIWETTGFGAAIVLAMALGLVVIGRAAGLFPHGQPMNWPEVFLILGFIAFLALPKTFARATAGQIWGRFGGGGGAPSP